MTHLIAYTSKILGNISRNSEANASEFLENLVEIFPQYYMPGD